MSQRQVEAPDRFRRIEGSSMSRRTVIASGLAALALPPGSAMRAEEVKAL
jgi:hypothetical protein